MANNPLVESSVFRIDQERSTKSLIFKWLKSPTEAEFKESLTTAQKFYREFGGSWITDTTLMSQVSSDFELWVHEEWLPQMLNIGLSRMAVILPESKYLKLKNTEPVQPSPSHDFTIGWFYTQTDARNWIFKEQACLAAIA